MFVGVKWELVDLLAGCSIDVIVEVRKKESKRTVFS